MIFFLLLLFISTAHSQDESEKMIPITIQSGVEYDTNIFKAYQNISDDFLTRLLIKSEKQIPISTNTTLGWKYQGGGKKYFNRKEQDTLIQFISLPIEVISEHTKFYIEPSFKLQNENNNTDILNTDVNEDYITPQLYVRSEFYLPKNFKVSPQIQYTYFHFYSNPLFHYQKITPSFSLYFPRLGSFNSNIDYQFNIQTFTNAYRKDHSHLVSTTLQWNQHPNLTFRYSFLNNTSNLSQFNFHSHKVSLGTSFSFFEKNELNRVFLHFLGTLQFRKYPNVFSIDQEGQRILQTDTEDENFNSLVTKITFLLTKDLSLESKYTRVSNELTKDQTRFSRSLYYTGLRLNF